MLGDALARILSERGHSVSRHYYVDDVGRQIAVLVYGYKLLDEAKPTGKADHWVGLVYAITSCIIEIERAKRKLKELEGDESFHEEANKARLDLDDWVSATADLKERDRALFESLVNGIMEDHLMQEYEDLKVMVAEIESDINKAEGGNKAAGTRVRKQMQQVKQAAQNVRNRILEIRSTQ